VESERLYSRRAYIPFAIVALGLLTFSVLNDSWIGDAAQIGASLMLLGWSSFWLWRNRDATSASRSE
jgi:hypothetical protein